MSAVAAAPIPAARKWAIAATAALGALMEIVDTSIVNVALSDMQSTLGATLSEVGWVITSYAIANVVVLPLTAWLGAMFGKTSAADRAETTALGDALKLELAKQKFAVDVRTDVIWYSPGRYYGPLSDLGGKLYKSQDCVKVGGQLGVVLHAGRVFQLTGGASFAYTSEHTVTDEAIGKDLPEPNGPPNGTVDVVSNPRELNPSFDWRLDLVGRRLRATEATTLGFFLRGTLGY